MSPAAVTYDAFTSVTSVTGVTWWSRGVTCSFFRESARGRSALSFASPKKGNVDWSHAASESVFSFASSRAVCWNADRSSCHACDLPCARTDEVRALPRAKGEE